MDCTKCLKGRTEIILTLLGGFLIHLALGTVYCFGNLSPYIASYLRSESSLSYSIERNRYGNLVWLSSFQLSSTAFGAFCSVYVIPISFALEYLPENEAFAAGFIVSGFGLGAMVFNPLQSIYLNPNNLSPNVSFSQEFPDELYFDQKEILDRVPSLFIILSVCYTLLFVIGNFIICRKPHALLLENERKPTRMNYLNCFIQVKNLIKNPNFITLYLTFIFNTFAITIITSMYKAFGQTFIMNDVFLTLVGSISSFLNASGRIFWGFVCDRHSYQLSIGMLSAIMFALSATFTSTALGGPLFFLIWVAIYHFAFSGTFSVLPGSVAKFYGTSNFNFNYGVLLTAEIPGPLIGAFVAQPIYDKFEWIGIFGIVAIFSLVSVIINLFGKFPDNEYQLMKQTENQVN
ncbi:hypothetical protein SNEBB_007133 [Seison nebaliae]|nr:hypothetical protein SNEBB_007133 [Seison nebaliae]